MAKAGMKRRDRRHKKQEHDPCDPTNILMQRSARCRQRWLNLLMQYDRPWANLPSSALLTIFRRSDLEARLRIIPLVCKSWKSVSEHPQYWSSMIPDSISPEAAFIDQWHNLMMRYDIRLNYYKVDKLTPTEIGELKLALGVSRLQTLIKKSGGGDAITSLYLSPFFPHYYDHQDYDRCIYNTGKIVGLVADCCPNLKHISFRQCDGSLFNEGHLLKLINKCKRLELIDFGFILIDYQSSSFIRELANCLPHLRGIRIGGSRSTVHGIAKYFPRLKLLNLSLTYVNSDELSWILSGCLELQYLNIGSIIMVDTDEGDSYKHNPYTSDEDDYYENDEDDYYENDEDDYNENDEDIRGGTCDRGLVYKAYARIPDFYFENARSFPACYSYAHSESRGSYFFDEVDKFGYQEPSFDVHGHYIERGAYRCYRYLLHYYSEFTEIDQYYLMRNERSDKIISQRRQALKKSKLGEINKKFSKEVRDKQMADQRRSKDQRRRQLGLLVGRKIKLDGLY